MGKPVFPRQTPDSVPPRRAPVLSPKSQCLIPVACVQWVAFLWNPVFSPGVQYRFSKRIIISLHEMTKTDAKGIDMTEPHLSRQGLAGRWGVSVRTVDRLRKDGRLPWVDLSGGAGARPIVRFRLCDVEHYEERVRQFPLKIS